MKCEQISPAVIVEQRFKIIPQELQGGYPLSCTELLDKESPPPQPLPTSFVKLICPLLLRLPLSAAIPTQSQTTTIYCGNTPSILCCVPYKSHITVQ